MLITSVNIYRYSIPMHPFTIATGTMHYAQNIFIRVNTSEDITGVGECSAFPMIVGETQNTCFEMAKDFAALWKNKPALNIEARMHELHLFTAGNNTIKSAFDMALYDIAAKQAAKPLYQFLGGSKIPVMQTDVTIGINTPVAMAQQATDFIQRGVRIIKIKLGKQPAEDIERVRMIREAAGENILLRIDANQGWSFKDALTALTAMAPYNIQFCEQPLRTYNDHFLPQLKKLSPVPLMADESVYTHYDAERMIRTESCNYVNIKFAKSGGILEATKINDMCAAAGIPCMMGGMLESRVALTAFAHFAAANNNIQFYDMDTCLLGHKTDPVTGGIIFNNFNVALPNGIGIGADVNEDFLKELQKVTI
jgi:L-Ala-D/L-Glu epimerase